MVLRMVEQKNLVIYYEHIPMNDKMLSLSSNEDIICLAAKTEVNTKQQGLTVGMKLTAGWDRKPPSLGSYHSIYQLFISLRY